MGEPSSGSIEAGEHRFALRVYYADTDAAGIVYHARYLEFAERARFELLRLLDLPADQLKSAHDVTFAVHAITIDYRNPARLGEALEIRTRLVAASGARLTLGQRVIRGEEALAELTVRLACVNHKFRPVRVPEGLRRLLGATAEFPKGECV